MLVHLREEAKARHAHVERIQNPFGFPNAMDTIAAKLKASKATEEVAIMVGDTCTIMRGPLMGAYCTILEEMDANLFQVEITAGPFKEVGSKHTLAASRLVRTRRRRQQQAEEPEEEVE